METTTENQSRSEKIKERRKEVYQEAQIDLKINSANLLEENINTFLLFQKYWRYLEEAKALLFDCDFNHHRMLHKRTDYYLGKASAQSYKEEPLPLRILKTEVKRFLDADHYIISTLRDLHEATLFVEYLETLIKNHINHRGFAIRDMIEWKKFTNGQS